MKLSFRSFLAVVAVCAMGAVAALAQSIGVPTLSIPSPTGFEQVRTVNSGPQITNMQVRQLRDAAGYSVQTQAATNTLTIPNNVSIVAYTGATAGTATLTLPPAPVDGQRVQIFSTAGFTTLTLSPSAGQTVNSAPTSLAANSSAEFFYQLSTATWFRIQ